MDLLFIGVGTIGHRAVGGAAGGAAGGTVVDAVDAIDPRAVTFQGGKHVRRHVAKDIGRDVASSVAREEQVERSREGPQTASCEGDRSRSCEGDSRGGQTVSYEVEEREGKENSYLKILTKEQVS